MQSEITDVNELFNLSNQLKTMTDQLNDSVGVLNSIIRFTNDYDGIDVTTAKNTLQNNLKTIAADMKNVSMNITDYTNGISVLDQDDFSTESETFSLGNTTNSFGTNFTATTPSTSPNYSANTNNQSENTTSNITNAISVGQSSNQNTQNNQNVQGTGDLTSEITERTVYKSPPVKYKDEGQISSYGEVIIAPGDPDYPTDLSVYHNNEEAGIQLTTGNLQYELSNSDYDMMCAIVASESNGTYDDALAVTSKILNRCETSEWVNLYSKNPIQQITAPQQYTSYSSGSYQSKLNGNYSEIIKKAVSDGLSGIRNHKFT